MKKKPDIRDTVALAKGVHRYLQDAGSQVMQSKERGSKARSRYKSDREEADLEMLGEGMARLHAAHVRRERAKANPSKKETVEAKFAGLMSGMMKAAKLSYHDEVKDPRWYHFDKKRGPTVHRDIRKDGRQIGEIGFVRHPEGHAEINHFFIHDPRHQGKGYGRKALTKVMREHGEVLSDTRKGTTQSAQRAMKGALRREKGVRFQKIKTKEIGGKAFRDIDDKKTHIFYARKKKKGGLSKQDLKDIEHNSRLHRQRLRRSGYAGLAGGLAGGFGAGALALKAGVNSPEIAKGLIMAGMGAGGLGSAWTAEKAQRLAQKKKMRGSW